ncbi:hypothetical protein BXZ70DRAFT_307049 [Cristinia sonorae]|uniref:Uncharacterized protein n=1 Tax=Cristinia sonorae TaxID=1940300 RepID=A0A8K0ULX5_9AGAR|nr:hypothetical protein BXZ70DRAFT_307049 [Cristinia sonorae]
MSSPRVPASDEVGTRKSACRIAEIVQFSCQQERTPDGVEKFVCSPIPRIFRICPGRPAVELTRYVSIDPLTGHVEIPSSTSHQLPKGKPWRDIVHYTSFTRSVSGLCSRKAHQLLSAAFLSPMTSPWVVPVIESEHKSMILTHRSFQASVSGFPNISQHVPKSPLCVHNCGDCSTLSS